MKQLSGMELLVQVARMYYEEGLNQQQIAKKLNMSRSLVSKLLIKAKRNGIVEIKINPNPIHPFQEIEDKIKQSLQLKYVKVVDNGEGTKHNKVSVEAGLYIISRLPSCKNVVISAGRTTKGIVDNMISATSFPDITFLPASGGIGEIRWDIDSNMICGQIAQQCGSQYRQIHAPIIVDSVEAKEILLEQTFIKEVLELSAKADMAVVGIGKGFQKEAMLPLYPSGRSEDYFEHEELISGDFCYNYFDKDGNVVDCRWNKQLIGLSLEQLRKIPNVVCVAEEIEKAENLYIAAKTGLVNSMIVDIKVAKKVLSCYSKDLYQM